MSDPDLDMLRAKAALGDLSAMRELASRDDPDYLAAMRDAISDVLGEDGGASDE